MKPLAYLIPLALLLASVVPGAARAEGELTIEPWQAEFNRARYDIERGRMSDARDRLETVVDTYEFDEVLDRASAMYTETYLRERRYEDAIDFMAEALEAKGDDAFEQTRRLYTATERRIRRARNRAKAEVEALQARYDDISWWNVFKIFDKLGRRKDLKEAEKDLEELEDLHDRFDPRYLFPVPALTVSPEDDGVSDDEGDEADTGEEAEKAEATPVVTPEATPDLPPETTPEVTPEATAEVTPEATPDLPPEVTPEATVDAAAPTDPEATDETPAAAETSEGTEASAATDMSRDTAKQVLAEEIAALVALIPEDKLDQADAILGTTTVAEVEAAEAESAAASEETSGEGEATEEGDGTEAGEGTEETGTTPAEGTLELNPSAPGSSETSGSAEVTESSEVDETTAAEVATLGDARAAYYAAYQALQQALTTGDQDAIAAARQEYLASVTVMQRGQAAATGGSTAEASEGTGPAAPSSSTTGTEGAAASQDAGTGPAAPTTDAPAPGTGVNATNGFIRLDRAGIQRGVSDGALRTSRGSLRR